jgi:hypothetical protein
VILANHHKELAVLATCGRRRLYIHSLQGRQDLPERARLSLSTRRKPKKAGGGQAYSRDLRQPVHKAILIQGDTWTGTFKRPRAEGSTPTEASPSKRLTESVRPGTYKEAFTDLKIAIFKKGHPEHKLNEDDQVHGQTEIVRAFVGLGRRKYCTSDLTNFRKLCSYIHALTNGGNGGLYKPEIVTGLGKGSC